MIEIKNANDNRSLTYTNKLHHIPPFELRKIIFKIFSKSSILKSEILHIFGKIPKDPIKFIKNKLNQDKLIYFLSHIQNLPVSLIDELYKQYIDTKNPSLFLSHIKSYPAHSNLFLKLKYSSNSLVKFINQTSKDIIQPIYQNFKICSIENLVDSLIEVRFSFESRIDLTDPKTENPTSCYDLKQGIIWISQQQMSIIIMINNYRIWNLIKESFQKVMNWKIQTFTLNKFVIDEIFGPNTLKRGNYYNPFPDEDEVSNKSISDPNLMGKAEGKKTNRTYLRNSSSHQVPNLFKFNDIAVSVNSSQGKISFRGNIQKSDLIDSMHALELKISEYMKKNLIENPSRIFKNLNLGEIKSLDVLKTKKAKESFLLIFSAIYNSKHHKKNEIPIALPNEIFLQTLKKVIVPIFYPICSKCESIQFICSDCGKRHFNFKYFNGKIRLFCNDCNEIIDNTTIFSKIFCENNHIYEKQIDDSTIFILLEEAKNIILDIKYEFKLDFNFKLEEQYMIEKGILTILSKDFKSLYLFSELSSFSNIPKLEDISEDRKVAQLDHLTGIGFKILGEKCPNYSDENCRTCLVKKHGDCIQRVVGSFTNADLHAHSPTEFGDLSFIQNIEGKNVRIVCLVKSYNEVKSKKTKKLTLAHNGGLTPQLLEACFNNTIDFICIISGAVIDDRYKQILTVIARRYQKGIIFIGQKELIRLGSQYDW